MKSIYIVLLMLITLSPIVAKSDSGYWRVEGSVVNIDSNALGTSQCELPGLQLRFHSRWSNGSGCIVGFSGECPWGPSWGEDSTNSNGEFSETSYFFADNSLMRDIRIQYQSFGNWNTLDIVSSISGATPHQRSGNVSIYDLGVIETTSFDCPTEFEPAPGQGNDGLGTPQAVDNSNNNPAGNNQSNDNQSNDNQNNNQNTPAGNMTAQPIPCGMGPDGSINAPDLSFVLTDVRHRDGQPTAPPERITWEVTVQNNGAVDYSGQGNCETTVEAVFDIPELNTQRSYEVDISGAIPVNGSQVYTQDANLGEVSDQSSTSYNVVMTINPTGAINESNPGNNQRFGCYTPVTETYVESPCASPMATPKDKKSKQIDKKRSEKKQKIKKKSAI